MAMPAHEALTARSLADLADHIQVPAGHRVEIVEGNIVVSPTPQGRHARTTSKLRDALGPLVPEKLMMAEVVSLSLPETEQRYIPDLVVLPEDVLDSAEWLFPAAEALLVVEVTSPGNSEVDRVQKLRGYARSGVPIYLLIDREDRTVSVFSEPEGRIYRQHSQVTFAEPIELPAPFAGNLDTSEFG